MSFILRSILFLSMLFSVNSAYSGAKSIAAVYGDFMKRVEKTCNEKYKSDKKKAKQCYDIVKSGIKNDCGSAPWDKCFFKDNGDYMEAGKSGSWVKVQKILDKAHKL